MKERKWIETTGGPIVILPVSEVRNWSGSFSVESIEAQKVIFVPENDFLNPVETDYGKACEIDDFIGTFEFGKDIAVVLNGEPLTTTYIETDKNEVIIARWVYADNHEIVEYYLQSDDFTNLSNWTLNESIYFKNVDYVMFDSAEIGFEINENEAIYFNLEICEYQLKTCEFKPDNETFLLLHKFVKV